ncbi:hypothetical protein ABZ016_25275 [Streptomyces sp. NPDC006372]|uniref:hypothetical protein n=1 Tax=Streptomyces sp. NPDC006372 TaxID=3155599 RepID=UPI0033B2714C
MKESNRPWNRTPLAITHCHEPVGLLGELATAEYESPPVPRPDKAIAVLRITPDGRTTAVTVGSPHDGPG